MPCSRVHCQAFSVASSLPDRSSVGPRISTGNLPVAGSPLTARLPALTHIFLFLNIHFYPLQWVIVTVLLLQQLLYFGWEYPKGAGYFRDRLKSAFSNNKDVKDPEMIKQMIARG